MRPRLFALSPSRSSSVACDPAARMAAGASPTSRAPAAPPRAADQRRAARAPRPSRRPAFSRLSHSPRRSQRPAMQPRALAANAAGSSQRSPWNAGPRGLDCSAGQRAPLVAPAAGEAHPPRVVAVITSSGGRPRSPAPRPRRWGRGRCGRARRGGSRRHASRWRGRRPARRRASARRPAATLGAAVLGVDRLDRRPPHRPAPGRAPSRPRGGRCLRIPRSWGFCMCQRQYCSQRPPPSAWVTRP